MKGTDGVLSAVSPAWTKILGLAVFLTLAAWATRPGWAQGAGKEVVADVIVVGNRNIPTEKIMRYLKTRVGGDYLQATLQADVTALAETRMFKSVRVRDSRLSDGRVQVYFEVQEYPNMIREIIFKNANHISEKDLESMTRLRKGTPLDPTSNRNACYEIQDHLKKKGRYFASVVLEEGDKPTDTRVVFNISEGPVVRVRSTSFEGTHDLASAARLRTQIDTSRAFLGMAGGIFNPAMIDGDCIKLEDYFKDHGFINIHVSRELIFSPDYRFVDIVFHVQEGQRFRVKNTQVDGAKMVDPAPLKGIVRLKDGEYYDGAKAAADVRNLQDYYGWRGFSTVVNKEVYTVPDEPGVVRVQYEIKEKPASKVGQIIIVGNDVTQDRVIRRVIGLYPGQTLRYPELRIAERDLARLNIFKTDTENGIRPTLTVLDPDSDKEYKDILVQVQETQTGSLMFGAGFNSDSGIVGSIVLNERNFDLFRPPTSLADIWEGRAWRGAGQELRVEAVPGTLVQRYSASVREPFLFDRPYSLTVGVYYNQRLFDEYTEGRTGGRVSLGHAISKEWTINTGLRIENVNVSNLNIFDPVDYTSVQGNNFVVGPNIGLTWDTRDSFLRPTEGGLARFSYEQIFGTFSFPILNFEASRYLTITQRADGSGKQVLAARTQVAWAGDNTPVFERFFAGGFQTIRGFEFRGVGPRVNGQAVGGDFLFVNSLEYQVPIRANDQLYAVAFVDSGTVESNVSIQNYRVSAGVGLRIVVPMFGPVPIALDFGFPIVKAPEDRTQIFSFFVGLFR
jgi:outer membrane protein insertion porin family